jgi:hypothetical protein
MSKTPLTLPWKIFSRNRATAKDSDSQTYLSSLNERERVKASRLTGVQKVLVVLSSKGMVFDTESLRQKILLAYPEAAVFFRTTSGKPIGVISPKQVDLLIDLTGPGQRSPLAYALKLSRMARFSVGRSAGLFRKRVYDRVYDEKDPTVRLPKDLLESERQVQKEVLALAGVAFVPAGFAEPDLGKVIALELPPLSRA